MKHAQIIEALDEAFKQHVVLLYRNLALAENTDQAVPAFGRGLVKAIEAYEKAVEFADAGVCKA